MIGNLQFTVLTFVSLALLVATVIALIDASSKRADAFEAAGKLTKKGWLLILVVVAGMELLLGSIGLFVGAIATIVYYVDVRPAVSPLSKRR